MNAPATFQRMMDGTLRGLLWHVCLVYLDDIIIYSRGNFEQHVLHIAMVCRRLRDAGLSLKLSKCKFATEEVEYLGHVLTPKGPRPTDRLLTAIQNFDILSQVCRRFCTTRVTPFEIDTP